MNNNFNEFVFIEKKAKNKRRCTKDVYISCQQGAKRLAITFYDGLHQLITSEKTPYLRMATCRGRLYFVPTDSKEEGYVITLENKRAVVRLEGDALPKEILGSHDLQCDNKLNLYYIDIIEGEE